VDDDIDPLEAINNLTDYLCRSFGYRDIGLDKMASRLFCRSGPRRCNDGSFAPAKAIDDRLRRAPPVTRMRLALNSFVADDVAMFFSSMSGPNLVSDPTVSDCTTFRAKVVGEPNFNPARLVQRLQLIR
jgi:hypothetical protein